MAVFTDKANTSELDDIVKCILIAPRSRVEYSI